MEFDVVILSYSKTDKHKKITKDCIASLLKAKNIVNVNILVLESYNTNVQFEGAKTVFYKQREFNYNQSMNHGASLTDNPYIVFCNNDLVFYDGWADNLYYAFHMGYKSVSPFCPTTHKNRAKEGGFILEGYQVGLHVAGWCIGVERKMFEEIGGFNDAVTFWYSDNLYAEQLKVKDIKHALVCSSKVRHLDFGSQTLRSLSAHERAKLTTVQRKGYNTEVRRLWDAKG